MVSTASASTPRLEIRDADGAFERLDAHLRAAGFFEDGGRRAAGTRADVYLGFGLAHRMRRDGRPGAPEPVDLPLVACRIWSVDDGAPAAGPDHHGYRLGDWRHTWTRAGYAHAVLTAREAIAAGEVYQVNLVQHLWAPFDGDPSAVAAALSAFAPLHPAPLVGEGWAVVSASPELFLARRGDRIRTMPIKGTRPRGGGDDLRRSTKDAAEHIMIVDLERNDLGRICEPGSVSWPELMRVRSMTGVEHLVSSVEGTLRDGVELPDILAAMFPGGSVTGAPKIAALEQINALEPVGRGASMGAIGTIRPDGDFDLALTIRTFAIEKERIHLWVGGGIVLDSAPQAEVDESWVKATPLLDALATGSEDGSRARSVRPVVAA
jgi:para-aminobenzoate synthetase component 1